MLGVWSGKHLIRLSLSPLIYCCSAVSADLVEVKCTSFHTSMADLCRFTSIAAKRF